MAVTTLRRFHTWFQALHPAKQLFLGYLSYILVGWGLLCLPITHQAHGVRALDHLFTATSAVSTTGLTTVSMSDSYNLLGEIIVLLLIQLGGIGFMTFGSFLLVLRTSKLSDIREEIGRAVYNLPASFPLHRFIRDLVWFTLLVEGLGALVLWGIFYNAGYGRLHALWSGVFHSVSAFCTAGFSLYNNSFESFSHNVELNVVIGLLSYIGAIGFIVFVDLWNFVNLRCKSLILTTKVILWFTLGLGVGGTLLLFFFEPSLQTLPASQRGWPAFFQAMTAMTTVGFNTVPIGGLAKASILLIVFLMVIGASPAGTGGGLKTTSFATVLGAMAGILRGRSEVRLWGHPIAFDNVLAAVAGLGFYLTFLLGGTYVLELAQPSAGFDQNLFEAASALGTVGLSMGITGSLTAVGKAVIIVLMFCGRLSPVTFGMALVWKSPPPARSAESDLIV